MSNYENIRPYSELMHKASLAGGTEKFIQSTYDRGFEACKIIFKNTNFKKSTLGYGLAAVVGIGVWELGKLGLRKLDEIINKPIELKVHHILSQPETSTHATPTAVQEAEQEPPAVAKAFESGEATANTTVEDIEASGVAIAATKETPDDGEQPLVICEDDLGEDPPEWFEKMYTAMCLLREECS